MKAKKIEQTGATRDSHLMAQPSFTTSWNLELIESLYQKWKQDPASVDPSWRVFFEGYSLGESKSPSPTSTDTGQARIVRLIDAYRDLGHFLARLDPLTEPPARHSLLELEEFGFSEADLDRVFDTHYFVGLSQGTLRQLLEALRETYARTIGVEYMHVQDTGIRRWLQERMEPRRNQPNFSRRQKLAILMNLHFAELFEKFLQTRYMGQKRFSLEGSETLIPLLEAILEKAPDLGVQEIVLGMAHRGRLNVLANILQKPYREIFAEFEDIAEPESVDGDGDVKYHLGFSSDRVNSRGGTIHLTLTPNPSHLEAVNPVVEGRTRAKQWLFRDEERRRGIPLLIHGDAAFAGQGLVAETLNLSQLPGYTTGGTIHVIINNQIGFTTPPSDARSTTYCTDVAKMIQAPVFHVNAEDPEAAVYVAELALEFRQQFRRDVVIDLYCYRRHGHNEGDEPAFTQPVTYAKIKDRPSLTEVYTEQLVMSGALTADETEAIVQTFQEKLQAAQKEVRQGGKVRAGMRGYAGRWQGLSARYTLDAVPTGAPRDQLVAVAEGVTRLPKNFTPHPKIAKLYQTRLDAVVKGGPLDWATAEMLAFGTLLLDGANVRLSGQDSRRGTFSQRHAVVFDTQNGDPYFPLKALAPEQGHFAAYDSLLSEAAVLGFELGFSLDDPHTLVLWEAQFGDFVNGAQVIIDQFLVCGESKWQRSSGLVLLLPHGYEGQGPEHSSARLERFLQLCAEDNIQVCYPTTPAQYFHVLRRQTKRDFRKPLVLMTPKSLLRDKRATSTVDELTTGPFQEIIDDRCDGASPRRVLLCSGKVFYDLKDRQDDDKQGKVAIVRVEQFYPFPTEPLRKALARYENAGDFVWVQEESMNMGGWSFVEPRLRDMGYSVRYIGRDASASPATGSHKVHVREQKQLVDAAFQEVELSNNGSGGRDGADKALASRSRR